MIQLQCPQCKRPIAIAEDFNESHVRCPECSAVVPLRRPNQAEPKSVPGLDEVTGSIATETMEERSLSRDKLLRHEATREGTSKAQESSQRTQGHARGIRPLVLAMTGASGAPYAVRLMQVLAQSRRPIHLVLSVAAAQVLRDEMDIVVDPEHFRVASFLDALRPHWSDAAARQVDPGQFIYHHYSDWHASIASGSFLTDGMVVCPCSMSTLAAIAGGLSTNLIQRAADVHLKERRKLILVPREMPLNLIHLENMTQCTRAGAVIVPAMPGWYHRPKSLDDLINFVVGRICDQLEIENDLMTRWGSDEIAASGSSHS